MGEIDYCLARGEGASAAAPRRECPLGLYSGQEKGLLTRDEASVLVGLAWLCLQLLYTLLWLIEADGYCCTQAGSWKGRQGDEPTKDSSAGYAYHSD